MLRVKKLEVIKLIILLFLFLFNFNYETACLIPSLLAHPNRLCALQVLDSLTLVLARVVFNDEFHVVLPVVAVVLVGVLHRPLLLVRKRWLSRYSL